MIRRIGFGFILWVIPYVLAIPLLPLATSEPMVFKSFVVSIATITSAILSILYFQKIEKEFFKEAIFASVTWIILNWALDMIALLPFSHETLPQYFLDVGIEYIAFSAPILALGYLLDRKTKK